MGCLAAHRRNPTSDGYAGFHHLGHVQGGTLTLTLTLILTLTLTLTLTLALALTKVCKRRRKINLVNLD